MSIWNKVLIGLIFIASIAMFILGARALKTHQYWRNQARTLEQELASERDVELVLLGGPDCPEVVAREQELEKLGGEAGQGIQQGKQTLEGMQEDAKLGLRRATLARHELLVDRGRVWYGCRPRPGPETATKGVVGVTVEFPVPHQIQADTVLWGFDEADVTQGGRYLGQFKVTAVAGQDMELQPAVKLIADEQLNQLAKLAQSAGRNGATWTLYELMPADNHESLAGLDADQLKAMLPDETEEEYIMDGQLTTLADVKQRGLQGKVYRVDGTGQIAKADGLPVEAQGENEQGKYVRQLRDYEELFREDHLVYTEGVDRQKTLERNSNYVAHVQRDAELHVQYRQREHDQLAADLQKYSVQRDNVVGYLETLKGAVAATQAAIDESIQSLQGMAGEIARIQQEATRIIDQRTRAMARANSGG